VTIAQALGREPVVIAMAVSVAVALAVLDGRRRSRRGRRRDLTREIQRRRRRRLLVATRVTVPVTGIAAGGIPLVVAVGDCPVTAVALIVTVCIPLAVAIALVVPGAMAGITLVPAV
jgi:hypothetical protein